MITLLPEELIIAACQMACYGFAAFTTAFMYLFMPR